jgi:hypothetical protein
LQRLVFATRSKDLAADERAVEGHQWLDRATLLGFLRRWPLIEDLSVALHEPEREAKRPRPSSSAYRRSRREGLRQDDRRPYKPVQAPVLPNDIPDLTRLRALRLDLHRMSCDYVCHWLLHKASHGLQSLDLSGPVLPPDYPWDVFVVTWQSLDRLRRLRIGVIKRDRVDSMRRTELVDIRLVLARRAPLLEVIDTSARRIETEVAAFSEWSGDLEEAPRAERPRKPEEDFERFMDPIQALTAPDVDGIRSISPYKARQDAIDLAWESECRAVAASPKAIFTFAQRTLA